QPDADFNLTKTLHLGDPDVLWTIRQSKDVSLRIEIAAPSPPHAKARAIEPLRVAIRVAALNGADAAPTQPPADPRASDRVAFEAEPNDTPETANHVSLSQTIYGLADDRPYLPLGDEPTSAELAAGSDWFTFTFDSPTPKLAFFALDFVDR